jgi:hypothetical protein
MFLISMDDEFLIDNGNNPFSTLPKIMKAGEVIEIVKLKPIERNIENSFLNPPRVLEAGEIVLDYNPIQLEISLHNMVSNCKLKPLYDEQDEDDLTDERIEADRKYHIEKNQKRQEQDILKMELERKKYLNSAKVKKDNNHKKENNERVEEFKKKGYDDFKYCVKCDYQYPKTEDYWHYRTPAMIAKYPSFPFKNICAECVEKKRKEYRTNIEENYKIKECECGKKLQAPKFSKSNEAIAFWERHYATLHHKRYEALKEKRITDFKIFTIAQLRKIIVYNKKDDGSYYVSNYPNKKKDEIIRLLTEYKDKIKIPDDL